MRRDPAKRRAKRWTTRVVYRDGTVQTNGKKWTSYWMASAGDSLRSPLRVVPTHNLGFVVVFKS